MRCLEILDDAIAGFGRGDKLEPITSVGLAKAIVMILASTFAIYKAKRLSHGAEQWIYVISKAVEAVSRLGPKGRRMNCS